MTPSHPPTDAHIDVRRPGDNELCGRIAPYGHRWTSLTVFGGVLETHDTSDDAAQYVVLHGLAALATRWTLMHPGTRTEEVVCIIEASPDRVTVARDCVVYPGVPRLDISATQLEREEWVLRRC